MAYVHKIIGSDEKLIGIGRLHWIYIVKGVIAFALCVFFAWALETLIFQGLSLLAQTLGSTTAPMPLLILNSYLMPIMMAIGVIIFMFYLMLVLTTEIALTTRRVMHKKGFLFVNVKEVDLVEIKGETLDLGYFGRILGYGYLLLDCRFLGDIRFPALEKPERFLKALHKARADFSDAPTVFVPHTQPGQTPAAPEAIFVQNAEVPEITGQDAGPSPHTYLPAQPQAPIPATQQQLAHAQQPNITINHVDAQTVAQVVNQVMPQMVEKITEEMIARGVLPEAGPEEVSMEVLEAELINSFDEASAKPPTSRKVVH